MKRKAQEVWKRNLAVCWVGMLFTGLGMSNTAPILPMFIQSLGVGDAATDTLLSGLAFGATFLVSAFVAPIWGWAADKYGRKPMLLRASAGMAIFTTAAGFAPNAYVLIALRGIQGALSGYASACITLIATQTPHKNVGFALGLLTTARTAGQLFGPTFGGLLQMFMGYRQVFWVTGLLMAMAFLVTLIFAREDFVKPPSYYSMGQAAVLANAMRLDPAHRKPGFLKRQTMHVKQPNVWSQLKRPKLIVLLIISNGIVNLAVFSTQPVLSLYIAQLPQSIIFGTVAFTSGLIFSASGLASVIAAPLLGRLSDKRGPEKIVLVALVFATIVYFAQGFTVASWQLLVLNFFIGFATSGLSPSLQAMMAKNTPPELSGRVFGYMQAARSLGVAAGSYIGGQAGALFGVGSVFNITAALLAVNAVLVYLFIYRRIHNKAIQ
jgi:MFS family permease